MRLGIATLLLLAACRAEVPAETANGVAAAPGAPDDRIECMIGAARNFARTCTVEIAATDAGAIFTFRKPDGGFRRVLQTPEGFQAADGAEPARATQLPDGGVEIALGGDRFRLRTAWRVTDSADREGR